jgi:hypothetical protein
VDKVALEQVYLEFLGFRYQYHFAGLHNHVDQLGMINSLVGGHNSETYSHSHRHEQQR